MPDKDRIEGFIDKLYGGPGKKSFSKREIVAQARAEIKESEGYEWLFEQLPDHEYDRIALRNAIGNLLARRT